MQKTFKKFIWKDSNSDQIKTILARSEYYARKQNFGNLAGHKFSHSVPLNYQSKWQPVSITDNRILSLIPIMNSNMMIIWMQMIMIEKSIIGMDGMQNIMRGKGSE